MGSARTRAEEVYDRLRADILGGHLEPGSKLPFAVLGDRYGVSVGALREALSRLVEQGLVISEAQQGYRVLDVSIEDLQHLTEARVAIECMVLSQSVRQGDLSWEAEVVASHHRLAGVDLRTPGGGYNPAWLRAHEAFHLTLLDGSPNPRLKQIAAELRAVGEVYRCWSQNEGLASGRDLASEHRLLAEAAVQRRETEVVELLARHIQLTTDLLVQARDEGLTSPS